MARKKKSEPVVESEGPTVGQVGYEGFVEYLQLAREQGAHLPLTLPAFYGLDPITRAAWEYAGEAMAHVLGA